jgi:hypothetical protein
MAHRASVARSLLRIARSLISGKERPQTAFEGGFWDMREKVKEFKDRAAAIVKADLEKKLITDLKGRGIEVVGMDLKLGRFRGSYFVTTCKLSVRPGSPELEEHLRAAFSPKFRLKETVDGVSTYNVR